MDNAYKPAHEIAYVVTSRTHGHSFAIGDVVYLDESSKAYNGPFRHGDGCVERAPYLMPEEYELLGFGEVDLNDITQVDAFLEG